MSPKQNPWKNSVSSFLFSSDRNAYFISNFNTVKLISSFYQTTYIKEKRFILHFVLPVLINFALDQPLKSIRVAFS